MKLSAGGTALWGVLAAAAVLLVDHPVVLAGLFAAQLVVLARWDLLDRYLGYARYAVLVGLVLVAVNPLVAPLGRTVLVRSTVDWPLVGRPRLTLEALAFGLTATLRLVALLAPFVAIAHGLPLERLVDLTRRARVPPAAGLAAVLSIRFLPALARDARRIRDARRARGLETGTVRSAGAVLAPLLGRAIDRGVDVAEVLEARGFGAGPRTRIRASEAVRDARWAVPAAVPLGLAIAGFGAYAFYPVLDPLVPGPIPLAFLAVAVLGLVAPALGGSRS